MRKIINSTYVSLDGVIENQAAEVRDRNPVLPGERSLSETRPRDALRHFVIGRVPMTTVAYCSSEVTSRGVSPLPANARTACGA